MTLNAARFVFALTVAVVVSLTAQSSPGETVVETTSGRTSGTITTDGVVAYLGIPYAVDGHPCGCGLRPALLPGEVGRPLSRSDADDCLTLNIWVPPRKQAGCLPVMVHIHGGSFFAGASGNVEPVDQVALAAQGLVVVSITTA